MIELKRTTVLKLQQLIAIVICWVTMGLVISIYDHLVLYANGVMTAAENYSFLLSMFRNMGAGFIGALIGGSLLVFYVNVKYQHKPYGQTILFVFAVFVSVVLLITVVMGIIIVPLRTGKPMLHPMFMTSLIDFAMDGYPLKSGLVWSIIVAMTQLLLQISSKFGPQTFWNIIRGKYNLPKEEERIFMFLDLNASTTIAEQLGNPLYHQLLKDFFSDITHPILENNGTIYQYVGDEVVISWNYRDGKAGGRCIRCFFDMKSEINSKRADYISKYGRVPEFKAGLHCGKVVAGEVGLIKRDITFSGDVLNTTSRILNKCKEFQSELIASSSLIDQLKTTLNYVSKPLGPIKLTGKEQEVSLYSISG